jgi:cytoskeleton protein RodZ
VAGEDIAASIGARLRAAREERGLLVEDVSEVTRIRGGLVRSIEADEFAACGGAVYARGHLRAIAAVVGLDPVPLVAEFDRLNGAPASVPVADPPRPPRARLAPRAAARRLAAPRPAAPSPAAPSPAAPRPAAPSPARPRPAAAGGLAMPVALRTGRRRLSWPMAAGLALLVVIGVAAADLAVSQAHSAGHRVAATAPRRAARPTPTLTTSRAPSGVTADAGVNVVVRVVSQSCWIEVANQDQQVLFSGVLDPGSTQSFHALQSLRFVVGNAGAFAATVNGRPAAPLGGFGTVTTTTYSASGQNSA